jgi:hypothetical protein
LEERAETRDRGIRSRARTIRGEMGHLAFLAALIAVLAWLASPAALAQRNSDGELPDAPQPLSREAQNPTVAQTAPPSTNPMQNGVTIFLELQRKSLVFPDLATTRGPLSSWEKFKLAANNSVALSTIGAALLGAGVGQARNKPAGYGQEWGGYGKRFGAGMARVASSNLFGTYLIASATHEDPRFYVKKDLDLAGSLRYAAQHLVVTRSDAGDPAVNYSGLLGPLAGEALANVYYPAGSRGVGSTMIRYSTDMAWRFAGHMLRQYWPEINRRLQTAPEAETRSKP